jgi:sugar lactone lactonase YvrE
MKQHTSTQVLALVLGVAAPAAAQVPLDSPVSAQWHGPTRSWFVSNAGPSAGAEPRGWIARLDAGDKKAEPRWLEGLGSPRGIAAVADRLYVADGTSVVVVDVGKRVVEKRVPLPGARLLHGIAADGAGDLYVSDTLRNTIYRLAQDGAPSVFLTSRRLEGPTALAVQGSDLIVATWGAISDERRLVTRAPGGLLRVSLASREVAAITPRPVGNLDGLVVDNGTYVATDRTAGHLLRISPEGQVTVLRRDLKGPAGIGWNPQTRVVAVTERDANNIVFVTLR